MPLSEIRRVVASAKSEEIVSIAAGPMRAAFTNEAIVKVSTISVNRGELRRAERVADGETQIGWDFAGTISEIAADGSGPPAGTRVVGFSTRMEGWSEFVPVQSNYLATIPDNVSDAQAATLPVAGLTALHAVDAATALIGRNALITGATGGVGAFAVQLAAIGGANVSAQIRQSEHRGFIERLGDFPVVVTATGREFELEASYRLIIDGVSGPILANAISALAPDGVCVCYGVTDAPEIPVDIGQFMRIGLARILGFHLYAKSESSPPSDNLPRLLALVGEGRLNCVIEREASWSEVGRVAQDLIDRRFLGKAVLHLD